MSNFVQIQDRNHKNHRNILHALFAYEHNLFVPVISIIIPVYSSGINSEVMQDR